MKRALLEWSAIFFGGMSALAAVFWCASVFTDSADGQIVIGNRTHLQLGTTNGMINFTNGGLDADDIVMGPNLVTNLRWRIPGFGFNYIRPSIGSSTWACKMTLLLPMATMLCLSIICFRRWRRLTRKQCILKDDQPALAKRLSPLDHGKSALKS